MSYSYYNTCCFAYHPFFLIVGQPSDGPMGISVALTPATTTVTVSKSMITNASFRTKKLPGTCTPAHWPLFVASALCIYSHPAIRLNKNLRPTRSHLRPHFTPPTSIRSIHHRDPSVCLRVRVYPITSLPSQIPFKLTTNYYTLIPSALSR